MGAPLVSLVKGLKETVRQMFVKPVTVPFPDSVVDVSERYRGRISINSYTCIGCAACAIACPNGTCTMAPGDYESPRNKRKIYPRVNIVMCMYCNLCEEVCPTDPPSIFLTKEFRTAGYDRSVMDYDHDELIASEAENRMTRDTGASR